MKRTFPKQKNHAVLTTSSQSQLNQFQKVSDEKLNQIVLWKEKRYCPTLILLSMASESHPTTILKYSKLLKTISPVQSIKYEKNSNKK